MIPGPYITEWSTQAPWPTESQIEQDLILSRLIIEIANDELLAKELAFRGGTCLHKLHLPQAARYSEDLDYTRTSEEPKIGDCLTALRRIADLWLTLTELTLDDQLIVDGLAHYMDSSLYSYRQLHANLTDKLANREFLDDIHDLAHDLHGYQHWDAAELLMQRLGTRLRNAPTETPAPYFPGRA